MVLSKGHVFDIDNAVAQNLHGDQNSINLPILINNNEIVCVVGLMGNLCPSPIVLCINGGDDARASPSIY
ncbi:MAG: sugar diacid recognition domain-containing protein [Candidatus Malihini olakiniferum]